MLEALLTGPAEHFGEGPSEFVPTDVFADILSVRGGEELKDTLFALERRGWVVCGVQEEKDIRGSFFENLLDAAPPSGCSFWASRAIERVSCGSKG
jgi:hypothetical protein